MRILVQVTVTTMLRHFTDVMLALADRGHTIRVASSDQKGDLPPPLALKHHPRISFTTCPGRRADEWAERTFELRAMRDYLRYLEPPFTHATKLRSRALRKTVKAVSDGAHAHLVARCPSCDTKLADDELVRMLFQQYPTAAETLSERLALVENTIPSDRGIETFLRDERPDVMLITPLIKVGSHQVEYVKSAKALGLPVGFPVFSWDNLSTKGLIHVLPDRMYVWNERQRREAVELHRVPADRIVVTGAPRFDRFFAMKPEVTREQFCAAHGLDASQPIVLYLCSSEFVAENERDFVMRWIDELRQAPALASCNIVIRPHPRQKGQWKKFSSGRPRVAIAFPESISTDQSLYDSVHHSAAVVGLNTSAELEAGIVGRPVLTIVAPEFGGGQQGTLHFEYLLKEHGGFVDVAADFEAHRCQVAAAVAGQYDAQAIRTFIDDFLRPLGRGRAVSPLMADAVEELGRSGRPKASWWSRLTRSKITTSPQ